MQMTGPDGKPYIPGQSVGGGNGGVGGGPRIISDPPWPGQPPTQTPTGDPVPPGGIPGTPRPLGGIPRTNPMTMFGGGMQTGVAQAPQQPSYFPAPGYRQA